MQAVRTIIKTNSRDCSIRLPEWAIGRKLEVIMLLTSEEHMDTKTEKSAGLIDRLLSNPLKVPSFLPLSREAVHER